MQEKGLIFDIQAFSVHDGPGCRTNVFFVGCPLHCNWCANPESFGNKKHIMFAENTCKWDRGCKACKDICPYGGISFSEEGKPSIDWGSCSKCTTFECTTICPNNSLKMCGKEYSVEELMRVLQRDFNSWGYDGGVTFSGGEPMLHHKFLIEILKKCKEAQIHTAIETSAYIDNDIFLSVMKYIDFAFIDVKNMNNEKHKEGTGVYNDRILDNIASLKGSGWKGRLILRQPTIGGYNDSIENAKQLIDFMNKNDLYEVNLLKFHRLGQTKWEQLGKQYVYAHEGDVSDEQLEALQTIYLESNIACYIADKTPF